MTPHFSAEADRTVDDPLAQLRAEQTFAASYLLRRQVDLGNAQVVWLAHDEVLGKDVSLHFIPSRVRNDADAMEALRHEVKRNRQLIHPQILRIYDLVETEECAAIAMDAFEGESLAAILNERSGPFFEPAQIGRWLVSLCRTLEDAHKIQLVHRDFSPANIYLQKSGELLVTRFGISRLICDTLHRLGATSQRESGLAYVSPQQLAGEPPASSDDIYSFGVLLHQMLAGAPPFGGSEIIAQIRQKKPASVMERRAELEKNGEAIPVAWEKVIAACLEKSAERRPKNMMEIAAQLGLGDGESASPAEKAPAANAKTTATSASAAALAAPKKPELRRGETGSRRAAFQPKKDAVTTESVMPKTTAVGIVKAKGESAVHPLGAKMSRSRAAERDSFSSTAHGQSGIANSENTPTPDSRNEPEPFFDESVVPDHYPSFEPRSSSFPMTGLAAAALLTVFGVYGFFFYSPEKTHGDVIVAESGEMGGPIPSVIDPTADYNAEIGGDRTTGGVADLFAANNSSLDVAIAAADEEQENAEADRPPEKNTGTSSTADDVPNKGTAVAERVAPPSVPEAGEAPPAAKSPPASPAVDPRVAAKAAALERAKTAAEAAEKAHQEMLKQKEQADKAMAEAQQSVEEKAKAAAPMTKAAEEAVAQRKMREEEMRAAETAAQQAQQIAAEKARLAEDAKKALATAENETKEKVAAQEKADAETTAMRTALEEKRRQAADLAKAMADATARRDEQLAALKRNEQELAEAEEAARIAAERRRKIEGQIAEARANFEKKIAELEAALKKSEAAGSAAPADSAPPVTAPTENPDATVPAENSEAASPPIPTASVPPPRNSPEMLLAKKTDPNKLGGTETEKSDLPARFENSLGMKFAPVGNILFCIWQTRLSDFELFARATGLKSTLWKDPGFRQGPDHPVVNVSWREAIAFCKWLTAKEQKEGLLPTNQEYRLPTDLEWSKAVGLPEEKGKTPDARDMEILDIYPWGTTWPPPKDAGNYTGEETGSDVAIKGYDDGFAWTSPVGSFAPNSYGLYDMGGNVWQWCMDWWNADRKTKVLRGGSWYGALKVSLLSSCRVHLAPDSSTDDYGFRCVIAAVSGRSSRR